MGYMKLLMDADCLIKLARAGLKDLVGGTYTICISSKVVQAEVVEAGKKKGCTDAVLVEKNIETKVIRITIGISNYTKGDEALVDLFQKAEYDAIATDDAKLTRRLKAHSIPFILPALIIFQLSQDNTIEKKTALWALKQLAPFISEDEHATVRILMEGRK